VRRVSPRARAMAPARPAAVAGLCQTRLSSGLELVSWAMPGLETAAVALAAPVGARHEAEDEHGLAHLYEHMLFKGTAARTARAIAETIEDVGGDLNAWTSREATMLCARVLGEHLPLALELLADLALAARFDEADLALERGVVLAEIGDARDNPEDAAFELAQALAFPGQALGRPILGTPDSVAALDRNRLLGWRTRYWSLEGAVLAVAGALDHAALVAECERLFGGPAACPPRAPLAPARFAGAHAHDRRRTEQQVSVLAFPAPGLSAPERRAASLFAAALGGGMSSRLFQEIREARGLAYAIDASHTLHADLGLLQLHAATRPADAADVVGRMRAIAEAAARDLAPGELARARAQARAGLLMGLEGCPGAADWAARSYLGFGRVIPPSEALAELEAVTLDEVRAAGAAMLSGPAVLATVGPRALPERLAA
jgi:predicted Zn-dependent peptidase